MCVPSAGRLRVARSTESFFKAVCESVGAGRKLAFFFLMAVLAWCAAPAAHAQFRTSIQGVVTDPTGAVIPGSTLTLTDNGTGQKQVRTSNDQGVYNFNALPPDSFSLVVTKDGFQEKDMVNLQLNPEQANAINVELAPGAQTQTVTVNASTESAMDTETANRGWRFPKGPCSTCRCTSGIR